MTGSMSGHDGTTRPDIASRQAISRVSQAAMCASWDADTAFAGVDSITSVSGHAALVRVMSIVATLSSPRVTP